MSIPTFGATSTAEEVVDALANVVKGKNVIVTGTSLNGIGFETARAIAKYANLVVITGYNLERLKLTGEAIKKDFPTAKIRPLVLDLSSFAAVRKAAAEVNAYPEPIHVLVNNAAGALTARFIPTADGYEGQVGISHLGPALFTALLLSKLVSSSTAAFTSRVVFVSSVMQAMGPPVAFTYETFANRDPAKYDDCGSRYKTVKCAQIVLAREMAKRFEGKLRVYSLHPGTIHTNITQKEEAIPILRGAGILNEDASPNTDLVSWKTIPQGAATTVVAAFDPRLDDASGAYLNDCVEANDQLSDICTDPDNGVAVWKLTQEIIGETFQV